MQNHASLCWLVLLWLSAWMPSATARTASESRPNVIFVLIDDLGWYDVGYNGSTFYDTPQLDALSKRWMRFDYCYTSSPMCSPTRTSIMTGKDPARHGVTQWLPGHQVRDERMICDPPVQALAREETTLAEAFQAAGYETAFMGKWHMGRLQAHGEPSAHGFDIQAAVIEENRCAMFYPFGIDPERHPHYFDDAEPGDNFTDKLTERAIEYISAPRRKPFFLYLSHFAMHSPIASKPELLEKYAAKAAELPPLDAPSEDAPDPYSSFPLRVRQHEPAYAGELATLDANIGRLVDALRQQDLYDQTIVVVTGDNGGRESSTHGPPTCNDPLRAGKCFVFEGGIRTPLLIHWPGKTRPGMISHTPVISTDFYPTLLDMAGLPARSAQHVDGLSLAPLIDGTALKRKTLYWHFPHYQSEGSRPASAIRAGDYKLIVNYHYGDVLLFNLAADRYERRNLAAAMPDKVAQLRSRLDTYLRETAAKIPQPNPDYSADLGQDESNQPLDLTWPRMGKHLLD